MKKIIIFLSLLVALPCGASFDKNLYYGMTGDSDVMALQELLTDQGVYFGPITGNFYSLTLSAVKKFQTNNLITPVSGYFGPKTRLIANSLLSNITDESGTTFVPATTTQSTNSDVVAKLNEQIQLLMAQLVEIQKQQTLIAQQSQTLAEIKENTTPIVYTPESVRPEVRKKTTFKPITCSINSHGTYCSIEVYYWENDIRVNSNSVTITDDEYGLFMGSNCSNGDSANSDGTQRTGNPLTCSMGKSGYDGKPMASFIYYPQKTGARTITASIGGVSGIATINIDSVWTNYISN